MNKTALIKKGLLLLGSFAIAYNLSELLHELGHATAAWITGGKVIAVVVHPFNWSYSMSLCNYPLFHITAGAGLSSIFAFLLFAILYRINKNWLLPLRLVGPITLINNGDYLLVDALFRTGGDSCSLINMGIHPASIIIASVALLILGFFLGLLLFHKTGLMDTKYIHRFGVLMFGIFPYTITMVIWNYLFYRAEIMEWFTYSVSAFILIILFAAIPLPKSLNNNENSSKMIQWKGIVITNFVAVGLVVFFLIGPFSASSALGVKKYTERPEDFPPVLAAPEYATDVSYAGHTSGTIKPYFLSYDFPESILPGQISGYVTNLHKQHDYVLLTHSLNDPNEVIENDWTEETEQINEMSVTTKQYRQFWLKIDPEPLESLIFVVYLWKNGKFETAYVIHNVIEYPKFNELYNYAIIHPEQFDPNDIEQLRMLTITQDNLEVSENNH